MTKHQAQELVRYYLLQQENTTDEDGLDPFQKGEIK